MAADFLHMEELVDAVIGALNGYGVNHEGGLPVSWFTYTDGNPSPPLVLLDHGDLFRYPPDTDLSSLCPSILVRGMESTLVGPTTGGQKNILHTIRVVHLRANDQGIALDGTAEPNPVRAAEASLKTIIRALFRDDKCRLAQIEDDGTRHDVSLTCTDSAGANIIEMSFARADYGSDLRSGMDDVMFIRTKNMPYWAVAVDLTVRTRTGGGA